MKLDNHDVQEILRLLDASGYNELTIETHEFSLKLQRGGADVGVKEEKTLNRPTLAQPSGGPAEARLADETSRHEVEAGLIAVRAPLPGTFYRSPKPGSPPFVEVGSDVDNSSIIGIVETMKLMNSVYADMRGTVNEIRVQDGHAVDEGDVLLTITPAEQP